MSIEDDHVRDALHKEKDRRLSALSAALKRGTVPSARDLIVAERLARFEALLPTRRVRRIQRIDLILLGVLIALLGVAILVPVPRTPVELELRSTQVSMTLRPDRPEVLLPGELGEVLALNQGVVTGAQDVDPASRAGGGVLYLKRDSTRPLPAEGAPDRFAVRLQEISIPAAGNLDLTIGVAYDVDTRGLALGFNGAAPTAARFAEVFDAAGVSGQPAQSVFRSIRVAGKQLDLQLFPSSASRSLTVLRNVEISAVRLTNRVGSVPDSSTLTRGKIWIRETSDTGSAIQPGDILSVESKELMLVREVTLSNGEILARISAPHATAIALGTDHSKSLMPSLFDWLRYHWPAQVYAALAAIATLWLAFRKWWTPS